VQKSGETEPPVSLSDLAAAVERRLSSAGVTHEIRFVPPTDVSWWSLAVDFEDGCGIAANVLRNSARSARRHRAALDRYRRLDPPREMPDHADGVALHADAARDAAVVDAAFDRLSLKDRDVADLCLREGLSPTDAAAALALPVGTVKSRLAHARAHLQRVLRPGEPADGTDPVLSGGHEQDESPVGAPAGSSTT
jgi:RNA polymerase sigma factor (sigma-70 family)